jgi:hypothetical protein
MLQSPKAGDIAEESAPREKIEDIADETSHVS